MDVGTLVTIRPEWRDAGEGGELYVVVEAEYAGRVTIAPTFGRWAIVPRQIVPVESVGVANVAR